MPKRPDLSDFLAKNPFGNAAGPFEPDLSRERAEAVSSLLTAHSGSSNSTPQVLGRELQENAELKRPESIAMGLLLAMMNHDGLGRGTDDPVGNIIVARSVISMLSQDGTETGQVIAQDIASKLPKGFDRMP
jgi:hypothetical protein